MPGSVPKLFLHYLIFVVAVLAIIALKQQAPDDHFNSILLQYPLQAIVTSFLRVPVFALRAYKSVSEAKRHRFTESATFVSLGRRDHLYSATSR